MVRRYDGGQIVGERDPMVPFKEWLVSELDHLKDLDPDPSVHARIGTLREVQYRYGLAEGAE